MHHRELGGACYIFLRGPNAREKAMDVLRDTKGVSDVYSNQEAARKFRLMASRIGDIFVLGDKTTAFGSLHQERVDLTKIPSFTPGATQLRTHGSRHEDAVPIISYGRKLESSRYRWNLDITRRLDLAG